MTRILITGATGFVGNELTKYLSENTDFILRLATRCPLHINNHEHISVGDLNEHTDWGIALEKVDVVIHLAARVHMMDENIPTPERYKSVNTLATINLAEQAVKAGVKRLIFLSSIKVNGEFTTQEKPFFADDTPNPSDHYGRSKLDAEIALKNISDRTKMETVIIRPPLIYGPGVKANFLSLIKLINKLPIVILPVIKNKRSLVSIDNLNHLIKACIDNANAKNQTFLVCDGNDLSTTQIFESIAKAMQKKVIKIPIPQIFFRLIFFSLNKKNQFERIFGSLQVNISKNEEILNWKPIFSMDRTLGRLLKNEK